MLSSCNESSSWSDQISWEASKTGNELQEETSISILSVYFKNEYIGISFYDVESRLIKIMEDVEETNSLSIVSQRMFSSFLSVYNFESSYRNRR